MLMRKGKRMSRLEKTSLPEKVSSSYVRDNNPALAVGRFVPAAVLIIEDEPIIADDLAWIVGDLGHHVTGIARTRAEAVALSRQVPPSLILSDIKLGDGTCGLETVAEILREQDAQVILVTGSFDMLPRKNTCWATSVIRKPYRAELLKEAINKASFNSEARAKLADNRSRG
jgi:CheY-like chemotaxis protein